MYEQRLPNIASSNAPNSHMAAQKILQLAFLALAILIFQSFATVARSAPDSFADLVERMSPAVVNITTMTKVAKSVVPKGVVPEGSPFEDLFRDFNDQILVGEVHEILLRWALALSYLKMDLWSPTTM